MKAFTPLALLVALLAVCQTAAAAGDAGELLLGERLMGFKPAAPTNKAKAQSGYYGPVEPKIVSFHDSHWSSCGDLCDNCGSSYGRNEFTCKEQGYDYGTTNTLLGGAPKAGSCDWDFVYREPSYLQDGKSSKVGKATATCTLTDSAEHCSGDSPVCEDLLMTIDADILVIEAFWATPYTSPLLQEDSLNFAGEPSCCDLGAGIIGSSPYLNGGQCEDCSEECNDCGTDCPPPLNITRASGFGRPDDLRRKGLNRKGTKGAQRSATRSKARKQDAAATTAYYSQPHAYSGTYFTGEATLIHGVVHIINAHTNEFRDTGIFEWIPAVTCKPEPCAEVTGTPPITLHPVTPGRSRVKFYKNAPASYEGKEEEKRY